MERATTVSGGTDGQGAARADGQGAARALKGVAGLDGAVGSAAGGRGDGSRVRDLLREYGVLDAPPDPDLAAIAGIAATVCGTPSAAVNLVTDVQQHQVATVGIEPSVCAAEDAMCATSVLQPAQVVLRDARLDPRYAGSPFVTGRMGDIRFYAASQLRTPGGVTIGTLCVFADEVRDLSPEQARALDALARQVVDVLELRRRTELLREAVDGLERTRTELQRSNADLAALAGQLSHDLKNPLTAVLGFVQSLAELPSVAGDPTARFCAERALRAGTRMDELIDALLAYGRVGGTLQRARVDLAGLVEDVLQDLAPEVAAAGAEVRRHRLPEVVADPVQLRTVLQNLLANALKFRSPERACRIEVRARRAGGAWRVEVVDGGRGVPEDRREEAFGLLARVHGRSDVPGHGIGLATVRRIVEAHGGRTGLAAAAGGGTTAWFTLPA